MVVFLSGPACSIVSVAGDEHIEKRVGVVVIGDPTGAAQIVIKVAQAGEVDGPFEASEQKFYSELFLEGPLDFDGDIAVDVRLSTKEIGENRQPFSAGMSGFR